MSIQPTLESPEDVEIPWAAGPQALWLGLLPPLFAYVGTMEFGWRLGVEPVYLPQATVLAICVTYFAALLLGFLSSAIIAR